VDGTATDGSGGFVLVSNGTVHSYPEGEALSTDQLYPGCTVLFSWEPWGWDKGIPTISSGEWIGWIAGDHTGIFAYWIDQGTGQFACVEGNTSQSSWDNGGACLERTDRFTSQVCGWWEPPALAGAWTDGEDEDEMTEADWGRMAQMINDTVANVWRAPEMTNLDVSRAEVGSHNSGVDIMRSDELASVISLQVHQEVLAIVRSEEFANIISQAAD
jgi:hypothetical protein